MLTYMYVTKNNYEDNSRIAMKWRIAKELERNNLKPIENTIGNEKRPLTLVPRPRLRG